MKITENFKDKEPIHIQLEFTENRPQLVRSFSPTVEEPIHIRILESGWNYGYPTYHVIIEYGDMESTDYRFMTGPEILKSFNIDVRKEKYQGSISLASNEISDKPNIYDLGAYVSRKYNEKLNNTTPGITGTLPL